VNPQLVALEDVKNTGLVVACNQPLISGASQEVALTLISFSRKS
jgi:hypothetical protein